MAEDNCNNMYELEHECLNAENDGSGLKCVWDSETEECVGAEPFGNILNNFELNQTCMIITVIFLILFFYKEEIMKSKIITKLLK